MLNQLREGFEKGCHQLSYWAIFITPSLIGSFTERVSLLANQQTVFMGLKLAMHYSNEGFEELFLYLNLLNYQFDFCSLS